MSGPSRTSLEEVERLRRTELHEHSGLLRLPGGESSCSMRAMYRRALTLTDF